MSIPSPTFTVLAWTRARPAAPGHFYVWQPADVFPCRGNVHLVEVFYEFGQLQAWVPQMDYADDVVDDDTWGRSVWMGPVALPLPPGEAVPPGRA